MIELSNLTPNPDNPRDIEKDKFAKLCESIKRDPKFMELLPIIIDNDNIIIAGNMRFRALQSLEYKSIPETWIKKADKLTEQERRRFIVIDNLEFGYFDFDVLTSHYSNEELDEWGFDLPVDTFGEDSEPAPASISLKIICDDLDQLIELRDMLDILPDSKTITFGKFKMIFENRLN